MKRYDSYKDSGVEWIGEIPSHWNKKRFSYSFNVQKGKIPKSLSDENNSDSFPYLSMGVLRGEEPKEFSNENDLVVVNEGDIGLLWDGSNSGEIVKINQTGILSSTVSHLSIKDENLNNEFSYYLLKFYENDFKNNTVGMGIPHVDGDHVKESKVLIPPLSEQQQIVSFLDTKTSLIDSLIEKTERKIELLKEKRTSLINEVVTKGLNPNVEMKDSGVEWIGEIPCHWETKRLKYISEITYGISPPDTTYNDEGIGTILINGPVEYSETDFGLTRSLKWTTEPKKFTSKGSLLFCLRGSTTGRMNITHTDVSIGRGVCSINSSENQWFLIYSMFSVRRWIQDQISGSTFPSVTSDDVNNYQICSPPISEQQQIVEYLDEQTQKIDKTISIEEKRIELLKEYRQSLISEVVTGKLKVTTDE